MSSLFPGGIKGLADTKFSGIAGSCAKLVGIDYRNKPGLITAHQKLTKNSGSTVDEFVKVAVIPSDGSTLWFSSTSGKIWREVAGTWTLVHTLNPVASYVEPTPTFLTTFSASVESWAQWTAINPSGSEVPEIVAAVRNSATGSSTTISVDVDVPNDTNMCAVVIAGSYDWNSGVNNVSGITFDGNAMTSVSAGGGSGGGFTAFTSLRRYLAPTAGTRTVTATFNNAITNRFIYVLIVKDVNQTTPVANASTGFESAATSREVNLAGTVNNQLRINLVVSGVATHTQGPNQTFIEGDTTGSAGRESLSYRNFILGGAIVLGAAEHNDYVYFATELILWKIAVADLASWSGNIETVGMFENGNDTYHPMAKKSLSLFIGDGSVMARVNELDQFSPETDFNVESQEIITTMIDFDIDLLIGTKDINRCRVLRWDTVSESWSAEDVIDDVEIYAFIRDDNYVYALAGEAGRLYFYDGEKLVPYQRIPGTWTTTSRGKINANAVGFLLGVPVFGFSNIQGNPTEQGVYGFGSYSKDYPKTLSLDFPISTNVLADVEIGAIITKGADMWVSWKSGVSPTYGVDKIDYSAKYTGAYLETMMLSPLPNRTNFKTIARVKAPYTSLPTDTAITFGYKKNYEANYASFNGVVDTKLSQVKAEKSIPNIANLQLRMGLTVSGNTAPEVEDLQMDIVGESTQTA